MLIDSWFLCNHSISEILTESIICHLMLLGIGQREAYRKRMYSFSALLFTLLN